MRDGCEVVPAPDEEAVGFAFPLKRGVSKDRNSRSRGKGTGFLSKQAEMCEAVFEGKVNDVKEMLFEIVIHRQRSFVVPMDVGIQVRRCCQNLQTDHESLEEVFLQPLNLSCIRPIFRRIRRHPQKRDRVARPTELLRQSVDSVPGFARLRPPKQLVAYKAHVQRFADARRTRVAPAGPLT